MQDALDLIIALVVLIAFVVVFVWSTRRMRKGGGGATVGVLGATYDMLSSDQRRAAETIVQRNAGQSEEEDASSDPRSHADRGHGNDDNEPPAD